MTDSNTPPQTPQNSSKHQHTSQEHTQQQLTFIETIEPYPFKKKLIQSAISQHFDSSSPNYILKKDFHFANLRNKYMQTLKNECLVPFAESAILLVYLLKFQEESKLLIKQAHLKVSQTYLLLFSKILQPKDELINFSIFVTAFLTHRIFFEILPNKLKNSLDLRFVYDIHHIIIFKVNGIFISDEYLKHQIDQYFNSKYLEYQLSDIERQIKKKKKAIQGSVIQNFILYYPQKSKQFFGQPLLFPKIESLEGGLQFSKLLRESLTLKKKPELTKKTDLTLGMDSKWKIPIVNEIERAKENNDTGIQRFQINLNAISPTFSLLLDLPQEQVQLQKRKLITHHFQQINPRDGILLDSYQKLEKFRQEQKDSKQSKQQLKKKNLQDIYEIGPPSNEVFNKHPKVNHLFTNMIHMNHILGRHTQSMHSLESSKLLQSKNSVLSQDHINYKAKVIDHFDQKEEMLSQVRSKSQDAVEEMPKKFILLDNYNKKLQEAGEINQQFESSLTSQFQSNITTRQNSPLKKSQFTEEETHEIEEQKEKINVKRKSPKNQQFIYENKRKFYEFQFKDSIKHLSTDNKINILMQSLQMKKNQFTRGLQKKLHKI